MYNATVFEVMISAPSDIKDEIQIVANCIRDWNAAHSRKQKIILSYLHYKTHSNPEMGNDPQALIDIRVLSHADLLVAIFKTRIGSKTPRYDSGTEEEIEEHLASGKPAMVYFSVGPIDRNDLDLEQLQRLNAFKNTVKSRGIYCEFTDATDLGRLFSLHLSSTMSNHEYFSNVTRNDAVEQPEPISDDARELLIAAAATSEGKIIHSKVDGGSFIQIYGRTFNEIEDPRSTAKWESALDELIESGYVKDMGHKGQVYAITASGYALVAQSETT